MKITPVADLREQMGASRSGGTQKPIPAKSHKRAVESELEGGFAERWGQMFSDLPLVREHRFHETRRWRFDFAHLASKIAVEIEGGIWTNGAHNRGRHFESDAEKYNAAAAAGWTVFRLSNHMTRDVAQLEQIAQTIRERVSRAINGRGEE